MKVEREGVVKPSTTRDPRPARRYAFAKRQPFAVAWFLESTEFAALEDFMPHLAVHEWLDTRDMANHDGEGWNHVTIVRS
ncbi:MAG: hypothetical protein Q6373_017230 [Candidatus Sigynarchaeota archaeon]